MRARVLFSAALITVINAPARFRDSDTTHTITGGLGGWPPKGLVRSPDSPRRWGASRLTRPCFILQFFVLICALIHFALSLHCVADEWSQFRGPSGDGVSGFAAHSTKWSEEDGVDWKVKVEGIAWSQPIIWGTRIFLTTAVAADQPRPNTGESGPGFSFFSGKGISRLLGGGTAPNIDCRWKLICLDLETGHRLWDKDVRTGKPAVPIHRSNSYASETPVTDGERVYVHIGMVGLYCFDFDGNEVWKNTLPAQPMQFGWGTGSSPMLHENTLYLVCDNEKASFLVAFDKKTGKERWRVDREESSNWSTPYLWKNKLRDELITCGGEQVRSYNPVTSDLYWELTADGRCATTAVGDDDMLYVGSATRTTGSSGALTAIKAGAKGDLSTNSQFVAWSAAKTAPQLASPLLFNGYLYALRQQGGIITCLDATTGKRHYRERLPNAGGFTASPWSVGKYVFCLDENGKTFVIEPAPELKIVTVNELKGMFWSSAALADGALLLRSVDHLYKISARQDSSL